MRNASRVDGDGVFIEIDTVSTDGSRLIRRILNLSPALFFNLQSHPVSARLTSEQLFEALETAGAKLNDAVDGADRLQAAWQEFDLKTGHCLWIKHFSNGIVHDPSPEVPALQMFENGKLMAVSHYQSGKYADPVSGNPAIQSYNTRTGRLIDAFSYTASASLHLDRRALRQLNANKPQYDLQIPEAIEPPAPLLDKFIMRDFHRPPALPLS